MSFNSSTNALAAQSTAAPLESTSQLTIAAPSQSATTLYVSGPQAEQKPGETTTTTATADEWETAALLNAIVAKK